LLVVITWLDVDAHAKFCVLPVLLEAIIEHWAIEVCNCMQALLNPLQGFLNSIVYRGVGLCYQRFVLRRIDGGSAESLSTPGAVSSTAFTATNADETSPLMHSLRVS